MHVLSILSAFILSQDQTLHSISSFFISYIKFFFYTFCVFSLILIKLLAIDFFSCLSQLFVCFSYFLSHCPSTRSPSWTISILPYLISYCQLLFCFFLIFFTFFQKLKCTFKLYFVFFLVYWYIL